jgi:hypothetical protein
LFVWHPRDPPPRQHLVLCMAGRPRFNLSAPERELIISADRH